MDAERMLISEDMTILQTLQRLDITARKVLFVVRGKRLVAAVTDGDVRRWILSNGSLEAPISSAANYSPKYLTDGEEKDAVSFMYRYDIEAVPILNEQHEVIRILFKSDKLDRTPTEALSHVPVVIMAGGFGKRLYPYTKILPKPLIPIGDVPIIERIMNEFAQYGCKEFYVILNHKKNMVKAYFSDNEPPYDVTFVEESNPLGTGGGLSLLKDKIQATFFLTNCDILIRENIQKIYELHKEKQQSITMVCSAKKFVIPYGVIEIDAKGKIVEIREKPSMSFLTNTGCYVVEPQVISELKDNYAMDFTDIIERFIHRGNDVGIYPISENLWLDMGQMDELEKMEQALSDESLT